MFTIIDVIEEIKTRIQDGVTDGDLAGIQSVRVGTREDIRMPLDYPFIIISIESLSANSERLTQKISNSMDVKISLVDNKLTNNELNTLYDKANQKGVLYLYEQLLNVLFTNTSGDVNLGFNNTVRSPLNITVAVDESEKAIEFSVIFSVEIKDVLYGQV